MDLSQRLELIYNKAKIHLWVPFLLPLLTLVCIEYLRTISWFVQIGVTAYILVQASGFLVGLWARVMADFAHKTYWDELEDYRVCKAIPTILLGMKCFDWAMTKELEEVRDKDTAEDKSGVKSELNPEPIMKTHGMTVAEWDTGIKSP